jgi:glycosyltransferase involved in cell wall biosynthesis
VTEQIGLWLAKTYHVSRDKIIVISNGVNIHRFKPKPQAEARKKYNIPVDAKVILSLGSLFPWAGIETLISAAPSIIEAYHDSLFLIGSGEEPYLSHIKNEVKKKGLQNRFLFYGFIPWNEAAWFISIADICAAPFIFKDIRSGCSSLRVYSYLACGKVVVGSNIPGLGDMLEKEKIGLSVPMGDSKALAKSVISLLDNSNSMALDGLRARTFTVENFSWESIVDRFEAIFINLKEYSKS